MVHGKEGPHSVLDMQGLIYRRRYAVDDELGAELENDEFRAEKERAIAEQIRFAGPLASTPLVAISMAGRNVAIVVEVGSGTVSDLPRSKAELDAALDEAADEILDGDLAGVNGEGQLPDMSTWEARCR